MIYIGSHMVVGWGVKREMNDQDIAKNTFPI